MSTYLVNIPIVDGPNEGRIINAFQYAYDRISPMLIQLTIEHRSKNLYGSREKITAQVQGIRYQTGTQGMYLLYLNATIRGRRVECKASYNANERHGFITEIG